MVRKTNENINTPELSERIFKERWNELPHYIDWDRFKKLVKYYNGGDYLDVGCFNSPMPYELKRDNPEARIVGIDHAPYVLDVMSQHFPEVEYVEGDIRKLPFGKDEFSYAVAGEVLEHMEDPAQFIKEMMRVVKRTGVVAISTPFEEKADNPEHIWEFSKQDIVSLLSPYGEVETEIQEEPYAVIYAWCRKT